VTGADGRVVTERVGFLGVSPTLEPVPQPLSSVPGYVAGATWKTAGVVLALPQRMVGVAQAAFGSGQRDPNGPIGLVGVGRLSGEVASSDLFATTGERVGAMLTILGSLNLALFVFNLVPLLPLDGGHVAGALWEAARRRVAVLRGRPDPGPFDLARLLPVTYVVTALLVGMSVLLLYADIVRPITLG
jgi:membrane-associated protease RseP (regulator of RpoE activity)